MRTTSTPASLSRPAKRLYLALIGFAALSLPACNASKPAETVTATPAATAPVTATSATGVVNKSAAARIRSEDAKVDGP